MPKSSYAFKLDADLQKELKEFCDAKGLKQGAFVERALREQMEREELAEDLLDIYMLRSTETHAVPLERYLKERK